MGSHRAHDGIINDYERPSRQREIQVFRPWVRMTKPKRSRKRFPDWLRATLIILAAGVLVGGLLIGVVVALGGF
jgi:hypothetical protein